MAVVEVGIAIGAEDGQLLAGGKTRDQVRQCVQRARIGPLQVVDHQDRCPVGLDRVDSRPDLEQHEAVGRVVQCGDKVLHGAVGCEPVAALAPRGPQPLGEGLRERDVAGDVGAEPEALAEQDVEALIPGFAGGLSHQARLADAGLTV